VYWLRKTKQSDSKFSNALFERKLRILATFRGMNTVRKLSCTRRRVVRGPCLPAITGAMADLRARMHTLASSHTHLFRFFKDTLMNKTILALLLCSVFSSPVFAAGYNFLKGSPISRFSKEEMNLFTTTLYKMLDESPDGAANTWGDAEKNASGRIEILPQPANKPGCRATLIANKYKTLKGEGQYLFCKKNGQWVGSPLE
jgi:hypothetical protein